MKQSQTQEVYKVILVGDQGVGKSSILLRYTQNIFKREYNVTIGLEFASKKVSIGDNFLTLQIWDTAGQEAFRSIVRSFYRNSAAIIIVYKITSRESFQSITDWAKEISDNSDEGVVIVLVGNMIDLEEQRQVSREEGQQRAKEIKALFFETSAANGQHIDEIFMTTLENVSKSNMIRTDFDQNIRDSVRLSKSFSKQNLSQSQLEQDQALPESVNKSKSQQSQQQYQSQQQPQQKQKNNKGGCC